MFDTFQEKYYLRLTMDSFHLRKSDYGFILLASVWLWTHSIWKHLIMDSFYLWASDDCEFNLLVSVWLWTHSIWECLAMKTSDYMDSFYLWASGYRLILLYLRASGYRLILLESIWWIYTYDGFILLEMSDYEHILFTFMTMFSHLCRNTFLIIKYWKEKYLY